MLSLILRLEKRSNNQKSLWIYGRVLRTSERPSGHVDKLWITLTRYPQLDHIHSLLAHIPTGSIINFFLFFLKAWVTIIMSQRIAKSLIIL